MRNWLPGVFLIAALHVTARAEDAIVVTPTDRSLEHALESARAKPLARGATTIRLRGGVYRLDAPIKLTPADSNLVVEAAEGDTPVLSGGRRIDGWHKDQLNGRECWAADVADVKAGKWYFRE